MAKKTPKRGDFVQRMVQVGDESVAEKPVYPVSEPISFGGIMPHVLTPRPKEDRIATRHSE